MGKGFDRQADSRLKVFEKRPYRMLSAALAAKADDAGGEQSYVHRAAVAIHNTMDRGTAPLGCDFLFRLAMYMVTYRKVRLSCSAVPAGLRAILQVWSPCTCASRNRKLAAEPVPGLLSIVLWIATAGTVYVGLFPTSVHRLRSQSRITCGNRFQKPSVAESAVGRIPFPLHHKEKKPGGLAPGFSRILRCC